MGQITGFELRTDAFDAAEYFLTQQSGQRVKRRAVTSISSGGVSTPARVNVRQKGAMGNGSADDAAAFNAAIDDVIAGGGGVVYVPPGSYLLNSTALVDASTVYIVGEGRSSLIVNGQTNAPAILFDGSGTLGHVGAIGLGFTQAAAATAVSGNIALAAVDCDRARFEDIEILNSLGAPFIGIRLANVDRSTLRRVLANVCLDDGLQLEDCDWITATDLICDENALVGLHLIDCQNSRFVNAVARNNDLNGIKIETNGGAGCHSLFFVNCGAEQSRGDNIFVSNARELRLVNTWAKDQESTGTNTAAAGLVLSGPNVDNVRIIGGGFVGHNGHGVSIVNNSGAPDGVELLGVTLGTDAAANHGNGRGGTGYGLSIAAEATDVTVIGGEAKGNATGSITGAGLHKIIHVAGHADSNTDLFTIPVEIPAPTAATYQVALEAGFPFRVKSLVHKTDTGTLTANARIATTSITGLSAVSVSSTKATTNATAANTLSATQALDVVLSSLSGSPGHLSLAFLCERVH